MVFIIKSLAKNYVYNKVFKYKAFKHKDLIIDNLIKMSFMSFKVGYYNIDNCKIQIAQKCRKTFPCKHCVHFPKRKPYINGREMTGVEIYKMLKEDGFSHPHFDKYEEYIRRQTNTTEEEIDDELKAKIKLQQEELQNAYEENQQLTNAYKASSRLDKLKAKHSVKKIT